MEDRIKFMNVIEVLSEEKWREEGSTAEKSMLLTVVNGLLQRNFYSIVNSSHPFMNEKESEILASYLPEIAQELEKDYKYSAI
jgi:hypothetical protein